MTSERSSQKVAEVDVGRLHAGDTLMLKTQNSEYRFTVTEPDQRIGTLLGGRLTGTKQAVFAGTVEEGKHEFDDHAKKGARALFFLLSNPGDDGVNRILTSEVKTINLYPDSGRRAA